MKIIYKLHLAKEGGYSKDIMFDNYKAIEWYLNKCCDKYKAINLKVDTLIHCEQCNTYCEPGNITFIKTDKNKIEAYCDSCKIFKTISFYRFLKEEEGEIEND